MSRSLGFITSSLVTKEVSVNCIALIKISPPRLVTKFHLNRCEKLWDLINASVLKSSCAFCMTKSSSFVFNWRASRGLEGRCVRSPCSLKSFLLLDKDREEA